MEQLTADTLKLPADVDLGHVRNTDDGFWVASTEPEAAYHALTGAVDRISTIHAAVMTDGLSRLVERYHYSSAR